MSTINLVSWKLLQTLAQKYQGFFFDFSVVLDTFYWLFFTVEKSTFFFSNHLEKDNLIDDRDFCHCLNPACWDLPFVPTYFKKSWGFWTSLRHRPPSSHIWLSIFKNEFLPFSLPLKQFIITQRLVLILSPMKITCSSECCITDTQNLPCWYNYQLSIVLFLSLA